MTNARSSSTTNVNKVQKLREAARKNTAAHRARREKNRKDLQEVINLYRGSLGEPLFDFSSRKKTTDSKSGTRARPTYNPPEDVASKMTAEELSAWRKQQKIERKRIYQAKVDHEKREEMDLLRRELKRLKERHAQVFGPSAAAPTELRTAAAVLSSGEQIVSGNSLSIEPIAISDGDESSVSSKETEVQVDCDDWARMAMLLSS